VKPEPLTKEKIDIKEIIKQYRYLTSVRRQIDFRDGFNHALSLTESAVEWLLKEIENLGEYPCGALGDVDNLCPRIKKEDVKNLIKKAFSGVVEE